MLRPERGQEVLAAPWVGYPRPEKSGPQLVQKSPRSAVLKPPSRSPIVAISTIATTRLSGVFKPPSQRFSTLCQPSAPT